jgi:hypothetical protein
VVLSAYPSQAADTFYVVATPHVMNATSELIRVSEGVVTDRHGLGRAARYGYNAAHILTIGAIDEGQVLTLWDADSGRRLREHRLPHGRINYESSRIGGGFGGVYLDSRSKTAIFNILGPTLTSVDLATGEVTYHELPAGVRSTGVGDFGFMGDDAIFFGKDGSIYRLSLRAASVSKPLNEKLPDLITEDHYVMSIAGVGLIGVSNADGAAHVVLDASLKRPAEPIRLAISIPQPRRASGPRVPLHLPGGTVLCSIDEQFRSCVCTEPGDLTRKREAVALPDGLQRLFAAAPRGPWAAFMGDDRKVLIVNLETGALLKTIDLAAALGETKGWIIPYWPSIIPGEPQE